MPLTPKASTPTVTKTVARNDPSSPWYSASQDMRIRKKVGLTLSDEEKEQLEGLAKRHGAPISRIVAAAIAELAAMPEAKAAKVIAAAVEPKAGSGPRRRR